MLSRRQFVLGGSAAVGFAAKRQPPIRIGIMDGSLKLPTKVEAIALAAKLKLDGVEINIGRAAEGGRMPLSDRALQQSYLEEMKKHKIAVAGVVLSILHVNYLKSDPLALKWIDDGIDIAKAMGATVLLLPLFGKGAIEGEADGNRVADAAKEFTAKAEKAGVVMGLENTISAEHNARILDRVGSNALKVYYDAGNSTFGGFDAPKEIRWLGRERICQIHIKDKGYLGEGKVDMPEVARAIHEIGYKGWVNLETQSPSGSVEADVARNLAYARKVLKA